jgi:hypothetical protein
VDVRIGENIVDFLEKIGQEGVSGVFGGVDWPQLTIGLVIGVTSCQQLGMRQPPRTGVTGSVELRNHSNPSNTSVLGVRATLVRKTGIVDDMPVQNVEFVVSHGVQILQHDVDGLEMPRSVQEKSSMGESREVGDGGGIDNKLQEI